MPYEYRTNICRTVCGADGEAVVQRDGRRSSHAAVAREWTGSGQADVSRLWSFAAAAGSLPELSGLRLGGLRLARPVPAARLVGLPADGFGSEAPADQA